MNKFISFLNRFKIYLIIILIIAGIITFGMYKAANTPAPTVFDTVTRTTVTDTVSETGNLQTEGQANINSPIEGIVQEIFVSNDKYVYAGQALFSIRSNATELEKQSAQASLLTAQSAVKSAEQAELSLQAAINSAQASVDSTQNSYNNILKGYNQKSTNLQTGKPYKLLEVQAAKNLVDAALGNLAAAKQSLENTSSTILAANASKDSAQLNYDSKTVFTVKATNSGTVSNLNINIGDKIGGQAQTMPALIISQNNKSQLIFKTQINENDIAKLKVDASAIITIDAVKGKTFNAKIKNIDAIGTNNSGVITYNTYFALTDTDETMRPGMSGNVDVEVTRHENVLTAANAAVKPYQDGKAVQVIDTAMAQKPSKPVFKYIPVKTGIKGSERTEITDGLTEGMQIVISGTSNQFKSNLFGG